MIAIFLLQKVAFAPYPADPQNHNIYDTECIAFG
jgi:hypothetical protein